MDRLYRVLIILDTDGDVNEIISDIFTAGASAQGASIEEIEFNVESVKADLAYSIDVT